MRGRGEGLQHEQRPLRVALASSAACQWSIALQLWPGAMLKNLTLSIALVACWSFTAVAATPQLTRVLPRGAQRGTEVELTFEGQRLADAAEVMFYEPGITL